MFVFVHCGLVDSTVASQEGGVEYEFPLQSLQVPLEHVLMFSSFLFKPKTCMSHGVTFGASLSVNVVCAAPVVD